MPELGMETKSQLLTHACQEVCTKIFTAVCFLKEEHLLPKRTASSTYIHLNTGMDDYGKIHTMDYNTEMKMNEIQP